MAKIDVITVDGSPKGVTPLAIENPGVGGSELMLMSWAKKMAERGHKIRIYNNPKQIGNIEGVDYLPDSDFLPDEKRDYLISFRGVIPVGFNAYGKKIGWSTDQYTHGNYATEWYPRIDKMIGISEFHKNDHIKRYGKIAEKMQVIDIGVFSEDYTKYKIEEKLEYQCIYSSVPDRGLSNLRQIWDELKAKIPQIKLWITGSFGLWNGGISEMDMQHRLQWVGVKDVEYFGRVNRSRLTELQSKAECCLSPNGYPENFGIALAENQVAGNLLVSSDYGALETTNRTGIKIHVQDNMFRELFIDNVYQYFQKDLAHRREINRKIQEKAINEFDWNIIIDKWEKEVFND
jgi:glycosyltransferase involved in cell wall biosynthesis